MGFNTKFQLTNEQLLSIEINSVLNNNNISKFDKIDYLLNKNHLVDKDESDIYINSLGHIIQSITVGKINPNIVFRFKNRDLAGHLTLLEEENKCEVEFLHNKIIDDIFLFADCFISTYQKYDKNEYISDIIKKCWTYEKNSLINKKTNINDILETEEDELSFLSEESNMSLDDYKDYFNSRRFPSKIREELLSQYKPYLEFCYARTDIFQEGVEENEFGAFYKHKITFDLCSVKMVGSPDLNNNLIKTDEELPIVEELSFLNPRYNININEKWMFSDYLSFFDILENLRNLLSETNNPSELQKVNDSIKNG